MNIKRFFINVMAAMTAIACENAYEEQSFADGDQVKIDVKLPSAETKVDGTQSENAVNDLQVFVFDHNKMLEAYGHAMGSSLSLSCSTGSKEIVALVNAKPLTGVLSLTDLETRKSLLTDNSAGSFVMEGSVIKELTSSSTVTINVTRIAARIALTGISVDFELEQHNRQTFQVKSVYLVNVAGDRNYLKAGKPDVWHSMMMYESTAPALTSVTLTGAYVSNESPYNTANYLYCYPNPTSADVSGGVWSARHTRLVVEAELGGKTYYYPVTLPELKSNTAYTVTMKITRPGSSSPDKPVDGIAATVSVSVQPWADGTVVNETI